MIFHEINRFHENRHRSATENLSASCVVFSVDMANDLISFVVYIMENERRGRHVELRGF